MTSVSNQYILSQDIQKYICLMGREMVVGGEGGVGGSEMGGGRNEKPTLSNKSCCLPLLLALIR